MEQTTTGAEASKRPQFLTVLCILTYIGSALGVIMAIMGYFAAQAAGALMEGIGNAATAEGTMTPEAQAAMDTANAALANAGTSLAVGILGAIVCFVGAMMMWKLKKSGFYMYVAGQAVPLIVSAVLIGGSAFGGFALVTGAIFPIVFIVLYAMNLKHMS